MPYLNDKLRDSIDDKISHLFNLKDKKIQSKKFDPAFTVVQNKLRYILHTATIMHGQMLEEVYLTVLKEELTYEKLKVIKLINKELGKEYIKDIVIS